MTRAANFFATPSEPSLERLRQSLPSEQVTCAQGKIAAGGDADDLARLSLLSMDRTTDVERDICRLALIATDADREVSAAARRLM
jgi:hypothetical protein